MEEIWSQNTLPLCELLYDFIKPPTKLKLHQSQVSVCDGHLPYFVVVHRFRGCITQPWLAAGAPLRWTIGPDRLVLLGGTGPAVVDRQSPASLERKYQIIKFLRVIVVVLHDRWLGVVERCGREEVAAMHWGRFNQVETVMATMTDWFSIPFCLDLAEKWQSETVEKLIK